MRGHVINGLRGIKNRGMRIMDLSFLIVELVLVAGLVLVHGLVQCPELAVEFLHLHAKNGFLCSDLLFLILRLPKHLLDLVHVLLNLFCLLLLVFPDLRDLYVPVLDLFNKVFDFVGLKGDLAVVAYSALPHG